MFLFVLGGQSYIQEARTMTDWAKCPAVESHPDKLGGAWVFTGTRLSLATLFRNLKAGATVAEFVEWYPGVELSQVEEVLQHEIDSLSLKVHA